MAISPFKVIQGHRFWTFGTNLNLLYDFLLVINSNLTTAILRRFGDTAFQMLKIAIFAHPSCV